MKYLLILILCLCIVGCCPDAPKSVVVKDMVKGVVIERTNNKKTHKFYLTIQADSDIVTYDVSQVIYHHINKGDTIK